MTRAVSYREDIRACPAPEDFIDLPPNFGTRFMLVVDTEEEFDWDAPFDRESRAVTITAAMERGQAHFAAAGVRPLYVTDYPVIDDPRAGPMLAAWVAEGKADVGAHCHPWVNPPHVEEVSAAHSFAGNLPEEWERAKITALRDRIAQVIGRPPLAFRAGRYGVGPNSAAILRDLGFRVDSSIRSRFNYAPHNGPDFTARPLRPYRAGPGGALIELPLSTAFVGALHGVGDRLQPVLDRQGPGAGLLARSGLLQRIPLTPEGVGVEEAIRAIDRLLADGLRLLMFSFHSPTLAPGHTPYVRDEAGLDGFYRWWDAVLAHLARRGVAAAGLDDVIAAVDRSV
ncbi:MAG: polysaccharide deacetylase family protein [Sphingobium sp.]